VLALTWLSQTSSRPKRVLAFTGALTPLRGAEFTAARGVEVYLGSAEEDPWISRKHGKPPWRHLAAAGAELTVALVPETHTSCMPRTNRR
jgi:predicted esterase